MLFQDSSRCRGESPTEANGSRELFIRRVQERHPKERAMQVELRQITSGKSPASLPFFLFRTAHSLVWVSVSGLSSPSLSLLFPPLSPKMLHLPCSLYRWAPQLAHRVQSAQNQTAGSPWWPLERARASPLRLSAASVFGLSNCLKKLLGQMPTYQPDLDRGVYPTNKRGWGWTSLRKGYGQSNKSLASPTHLAMLLSVCVYRRVCVCFRKQISSLVD